MRWPLITFFQCSADDHAKSPKLIILLYLYSKSPQYDDTVSFIVWFVSMDPKDNVIHVMSLTSSYYTYERRRAL